MENRKPLSKIDSFAALKYPGFSAFLLARFFITSAFQMTMVLIGWKLYEWTHDPLSLGLLGLTEVLFSFPMVLLAGHYADHHSRKKIVFQCLCLLGLAYAFLWVLVMNPLQANLHQLSLALYALMALMGVGRGLIGPAIFGLMSQLVNPKDYGNSATWASTVFHMGLVFGPATAGLIYGLLGSQIAFMLPVLSLITALLLLTRVPSTQILSVSKESLSKSIRSGIHFVFKSRVIFGALSLDMFAVLFGGVVAVLPIFASDILQTGPMGLGLLRSAPALGALIMAGFLIKFPVRQAGKVLLMAVAGFGLTLMGFAFSKNFYFSLFLLVLSGAFDNISVIIRSTLIQTFTPDAMKGRVAAVNQIFIGSSNELGAFESGLAAKLLGLIPSVVFGASMTLAVVIVTALRNAELRKLKLSPSRHP